MNFLEDNINIIYGLRNKPKGNLLNHLRMMSVDQLKLIYNCWFPNKKLDNLKRVEMANKINSVIMNDFKDTLLKLLLKDIKNLEKIINKEEVSDYKNLITRGLVFVYNDEYFVPDDVKDNLINCLNDKDFVAKINQNEVLLIANVKIIIYGLLELDSFFDICRKEFNLVFDKEKAIDELEKLFEIKTIDDKKYIGYKDFDFDGEYETLARPLPYNKDFAEEMAYLTMISFQLIFLLKSINKDKNDLGCLISQLLMRPYDVIELLKVLSKKFKLNNEKQEILKKELIKLQDEIIYWVDNGEKTTFKRAREYSLISKPKDKKLKSCLELLNKDALNKLYKRYNVTTIAELVPLIMNNFSEYTFDFNEELDNISLLLKNDIIEELVRSYEIESGYYFIYNNKVLLPDEIRNELVMACNMNEAINYDYISEYILINGMIKRSKLQEILKEYHNIKCTLNELDRLVSDREFWINGDYYQIDDDYTEFETNLILSNKDNIPYKILNPTDYNPHYLVSDIADEVRQVLFKTDIDEFDRRRFIGSFMLLLHLNIFNKDKFWELMRINNSIIKKEYYNEIVNIANKYKNIIPLWNYNGFSKNEIIGSKTKKEKVGRNDPCPCGSGKKYKKCCGS